MPDEQRDPEIDAKHRHLEKLIKNNVAIEEDLARHKLGINPWVVVNLRIDMLLNVLLDESSRYDFEIESATNVHRLLMEIQQVQARQKLLVPKSPGLIT